MRRLLTLCAVLLALVLCAGVASAFVTSEQITVAASPIGFTASKLDNGYSQAKWAFCRVRTAEISYRADGGTPSASVGTLLEIGDTIRLTTREQVLGFLAIRTGSSSGQLDCTYGD